MLSIVKKSNLLLREDKSLKGIMNKEEPLTKLSSSRPGNQVLRRCRAPQDKPHSFLQAFSQFFKTSGKKGLRDK
jgi:hypothetical protein